MAKSETSLTSCLGMIAYSIVTVPLGMMLYGWSLAKMWAWFVIPVFHLPALSVAYAIGVASTIRLITYQHDSTDSGDEDKDAWVVLLKGTLKSVFLCGGTLAFGWIVKQFV